MSPLISCPLSGSIRCKRHPLRIYSRRWMTQLSHMMAIPTTLLNNLATSRRPRAVFLKRDTGKVRAVLRRFSNNYHRMGLIVSHCVFYFRDQGDVKSPSVSRGFSALSQERFIFKSLGSSLRLVTSSPWENSF